MFGTAVNNKSLKDLVVNRTITIVPFNPELIRTIHYPLRVSKVLECLGRNGGEPKFKVRADFTADQDTAMFDAKEYLVVELRERISVCEGIVGHFVPSSKLVDYGFSLTCGRVEAPYGERGEVIRFGILNNLSLKNSICKDDVIAHVYFTDLRALSNLKYEIPAEDKKHWEKWIRREKYARDAGVHPID